MSRWLPPTKQQTITAASEKELDMRLKDKEKQGYKVLKRGSHFTGYGIRKYTAVVEKVS